MKNARNIAHNLYGGIHKNITFCNPPPNERCELSWATLEIFVEVIKQTQIDALIEASVLVAKFTSTYSGPIDLYIKGTVDVIEAKIAELKK